jgi:hypothetical protein
MTTAEGMPRKSIDLESVQLDGESYFKISNHDEMRPFLMSLVSDGNHWMFVSSNGGLTAGRKNANYALFPYYTDDKLTESHDLVGSKTILRVVRNGQTFIWEPFSDRFSGLYEYSRNLYKNTFGNKLVFEEFHIELGVTFRYQWSTSNQFGFVRKAYLINESDTDLRVEMIDGIQDLMPYGVPSDLQMIRSNLVDAYKRSELDDQSGIGIYALSAIIIDRAEPSEALKANIAWSLGFHSPTYLLSSSQLDRFRKGQEVKQEVDIKAEKGAYLVQDSFILDAHSSNKWMIVANVNQSASDIAYISTLIDANKNIEDTINADIQDGLENLKALIAASDGFQLSADERRNARHYSNTLFNIMRGGIFDHNYQIDKQDFSSYLSKANKKVFQDHSKLIDKLSETFSFQSLRKMGLESKDADFTRLAIEYMPLKFSRRHGDPSRPWNKFSINTHSEEDGSKILDYEGNWRDIFQNWEALAHSYPEFVESMIFKFVNASTFDGYNPYRITKDGFDWEVIEEHDPWSYIGYWGDHQIIYLLKFLEFAEDYYPGSLSGYFEKECFVYANVPYKIKSYSDTLSDPKDTIDFDDQLDQNIRSRREELGADGALLESADQKIYHVNLIEKLLATVLAKISNFIPEGGIWLNTQRPEWNDANNALVGNGVSMVTLYYLRRFLNFLKKTLAGYNGSSFGISNEFQILFKEIKSILESNTSILADQLSDQERRAFVDKLGSAASKYRLKVYEHSFSGRKEVLQLEDLKGFVDLCLVYLDHSIEANVRSDGMYHAYNIMTLEEDGSMSISHLSEMLEGQVAVLSSGYLSGAQCLSVLDAMKQSKLFREDQYSYLLYPNKELPGFLDRNILPEDRVKSSRLLQKLVAEGNRQVIEKDIKGQFHFNGNFNNAESLKKALAALPSNYQTLVEEDQKLVLKIFEEVFNHKAFTGRSGTFYGYEGLGSIYWHMVSKLLLAVEECCLSAINNDDSQDIIGRLLEHFYEINEGIGAHKSPKLYGAYPIDPYSHTPMGKGAQQPGMTGQVKEDILTRIGELGVFVERGCIHFAPRLLKEDELLQSLSVFQYIDINQKSKSITLSRNSLAFTYCQVPVIYQISDKSGIEVHYIDGSHSSVDASYLDRTKSQQIFKRTGEIERITVTITKKQLR